MITGDFCYFNILVKAVELSL